MVIQIGSYSDFLCALREAGFSMGGGNSEGVYAAIPWSWNEEPPYATPVRWHTGDPDTDPWEWRMRVLDEQCDIAYGKIFFKKSGFITKEWYPYFLAVRRDGMSFDEAYLSGVISRYEKRIYDAVREHETLPLEAVKRVGGFGKDEKSAFDRALTELQMKMYLTMCGSRQKISQMGMEYGWSSTVFCTTEQYFGEEVFMEAAKLDKEQAAEKIAKQAFRLNPEAQPKKVMKFIQG